MDNESPTKTLFESVPSPIAGTESKPFAKPQSPRHTKHSWLRTSSSNSVTLSRLSGTESPTSPRQAPALSRLNSEDFFNGPLSGEVKNPASLEAENADLKHAFGQLLRENDTVKLNERMAKEDVLTLQQRNDELAKELEEEKEANKKLNEFHGKVVDEHREDLTAADTELAAKDIELRVAKDENKKLSSEKEDQKRLIQDLEEQLALVQADHEMSTSQVALTTQKFHDLKAENQAKTETEGGEIEEIQRLSVLIQQKDAQLGELHTKCIVKHEEAEESIARCHQLEEQLQVEAQYNQALTKQTHAQSEEIESTHRHLEELRKRLEDATGHGGQRRSMRFDFGHLKRSKVHITLDMPPIAPLVKSVATPLGMKNATTIIDEPPETSPPDVRLPIEEHQSPKLAKSKTISITTEYPLSPKTAPPFGSAPSSTLSTLTTSLLTLVFLFLAWAVYLAEFVDRSPTGAFGFGGSNADNWATRTKASLALSAMQHFGISRSIYF